MLPVNNTFAFEPRLLIGKRGSGAIGAGIGGVIQWASRGSADIIDEMVYITAPYSAGGRGVWGAW